MSENFEGTVVVERILSQLEHGCIFAGRNEAGDPLRVKFSGSDVQPLVGDSFLVRGQLVEFQDRFRNVSQVNAKRMTRVVGVGDLLGPWLERLPNIGPTRVQRLLAAFGHDLAEVLADVGRMSEVALVIEPTKPALAAKIAAQVFAAVAEKDGTHSMRAAEVDFLIFLERLGIREARVASQLWRFMAGLDPTGRLRRNPYLPACLVDWPIADRVGQRLLRAAEVKDLTSHKTRLVGALNSVWRELLADGDTAASKEAVVALLEARDVDPEAALSCADEMGLLRRTGALFRVPGAAWLEDQVSSALAAMETSPPSLSPPTGSALETLVYSAEDAAGLRLTDEQHAAVARLLTLPVAGLQGGAGVGKTTVMKVLATAWEMLGGDVVLGALAGKASLTLARGASSAGRPRVAFTIARLIGMLERQQDENRKRTASDVDFTARTLLIIDEAGMMDTVSLHRLLSMLPEGARLLVAGDEGQLPPVGMGKIFHDIVTEGSRVARLTKILRQASDSDIPRVSAVVRAGEAPELLVWSGEQKGVFIVPSAERDPAQRSLRSRGELMVIAAKKATVADINETESLLRRSGSTLTRRLGPLATVAVGDPVVMTTNRYQEGLFNGLLGVITSIDAEGVSVLWDGEQDPRRLSVEAEGDIELAFAITCHKSQGSSAHAVIVVIESSALVTREWLYTAITRGRELVLLVCNPVSLAAAVARRTTRTTGFQLPPRIPA